MGEVAAGEVGGSVGLIPADVVEKLIPDFLHGKADRVNVVHGAGDPDGTVVLEYPPAGGEPSNSEFVVGDCATAFVPVAFVYGYHFAVLASDAAVGEVIRRVGIDHGDGFFRDSFKDFKAVTEVEGSSI